MTSRSTRLAAGVLCAFVAASPACGYSGVGEATLAPSPPEDAGVESAALPDGSTPDADAAADSAVIESFGAQVTVATGLSDLVDIACDEEAAFVAVVDPSERSVILRVSEGAAPMKLASDQYRGRATAVDDTRVYWVSGEPSGGHSYVRTTLKNEAAAPESYYDDGFGSSSFSALTIKGTVIAFFASTGGGRVFRGATNGLGGFDVAKNTGTVDAVAIDGPFVYWLPATADVVMRSSSTDAGPPETFATGTAMRSLAIANGEVIWASDDGLLRALRTTSPNGLPRQVAGGLMAPRNLTVDSRRAYWVTSGSGAIATVPLAGGATEVIGAGVASSKIASCANAIWFTNPTAGSILRVARGL